MRLFAFAAFLSLFASTAFAIDAQSWQKQLQSEMTRIEQRSPMLKAQGNVSVAQRGNDYVATLPTLVITAADHSKWTVPAIDMIAPAASNATGKVTIQLPKTISYKEANGTIRSTISIGQQNLAGTWNFAKNYFENLDGTLSDISFDDKISMTQSTVDLITLKAANAARADITATNLDSNTVKDGKTTGASVAKMAVGYQFTGTPQLTITRVIGLLNPVWLLAENQPFTIAANASQLGFSDGQAQNATIASLMATTKIQPKNNGAILGAQTDITLTDAVQTPATAYDFILPKKLHLAADIVNMPLQALSFAPGQGWEMAKKAAAQAGTQITLNDITWTTNNPSSLKGKGALKANDTVPLGMTGKVTFDINDLQALITSVQQQMSRPGTDAAVKTKSFMVLMMLQGLGKQNSQTTQFILDLAETGQVLVNGNDISGLLPGAKTSPAAGLGSALQGLIGKPTPNNGI